ncbi:ANKRD17 (predicted), partial [Pycnogonum litorale]
GAVNTSSTSSIASGIDGVTAATRAAAYLPGIQPGMLDNLQLQGNVPNVSSTLQPPLVRQNVPLSPHSLLLNNNNANLSNKPSNSPATSNVLKQDATLMTPQLVQLIKNCQQQAAMVNVASELSYDFEKSLVEGVSNAAAVAAAGMGLDLGMVGMDDKDLRPSERLEACINNMMKKAEMMHHNREEQILQKQQILEELQRVERELQEKAQAQILLNAQYRLENIQQNLSNPNAANNLLNSTSILDEAVNSLVSPSEIAFKGQANLNLKSHLNHLNEDDFVNSSNEKLLASDSEQHVIKPPPTSMKSDAGNNQGNILPSKSTVTKQRKASKNNEAKTSESMLNESDNCRLESSEIFGVLDEDDASSSMLITSAPPITPSDSNTISIAKTPSSTSLNGSSACTSLPAVPSSEAKFVNTSTTALISSTSASNVSKCSVAQSSMKVSLAKSSVAVKVNDSQDSSDICSTSVTANAATSNLNIPALVNKLPSLLRNKNIMKLKHNKSQGINVPRLQSPLVVDLPPLDDDIVPANSLPEIPQYHPAMFPGDQQVQTAMALAAQAYIPQTTAVSSCTVATQCMVDPCLMGPAPIPPGIPDTTTIPVPFLPSNQSPSSPQMSPSLYPTLGKFDVDSQTDSNHDTALTLACAGGYEELVTLLIQRSASIEHRDKKGFTPLILAATAGHAGVVEILLNHGAEIEAQSERTKDTPLSLACSGGRYEVVEILLARGANKEHRNVSDYTPLSLAASGGYVNIIKLLLNHGAEINSRTGSKLGISPLMLAAMNGHTAAVKLLLDMGSDINAQIETNRNTALTLACFQGRHEVVSLLVDRKANIEHRAKTGLTPLMEAASGGYTEVGRVLLDKGADVNAPPVPSSRDTALTIAADKGHYRFVELLLSRNAAVDVKNKKGNSPLWLSCNGGHLDVVQLLVTSGADIDSQDNRKVSCLMSAFRKGHIKVVKWMVKHVSQFPSDTECTRYIATINDKELLKKCHQCMETIRMAKERQEAEANKNASILLEELDMEKSREESKKAAAARRRERK